MAKSITVLIPQKIVDEWQKTTTVPLNSFLSEALSRPKQSIIDDAKWNRVTVTIDEKPDIDEVGMCRYARTAILTKLFDNGEEN